jgi:hypothetical protein
MRHTVCEAQLPPIARFHLDRRPGAICQTFNPLDQLPPLGSLHVTAIDSLIAQRHSSSSTGFSNCASRQYNSIDDRRLDHVLFGHELHPSFVWIRLDHTALRLPRDRSRAMADQSGRLNSDDGGRSLHALDACLTAE